MKTRHPFTVSADADTPFWRITNPLEYSGGQGLSTIIHFLQTEHHSDQIIIISLILLTGNGTICTKGNN